MMGTGHRLSTAAWVGAGTVAVGLPPVQAVVCTALATTVAGGRWSPDIDQYDSWKALTRVMQAHRWGRRSRGSDPTGMWRHRCVTHWWGWEVLAALAVVTVVPQFLWFVALAPVAGWTSHLAGDFVIGGAGGGRGAGVPVLPWGPWIGLGLRCQSVAEYLVCGLSPVVSVVFVWGRWSGRW